MEGSVLGETTQSITINYRGTENQWNNIELDERSYYYLQCDNITINYTGE